MSHRSTPPEARAKPLKRPSQSRAKATVQALFDAFVRIWQREGWERATTRAIALEAGVAVGTLYEYFPNKLALQSGYIRYCIEQLILQVNEAAIEPPDLPWEERLHRMLQRLCGVQRDGMPWFHPKLLELEPSIAEHKHQQRAHDELREMWHRLFAACPDLPRPIAPATVDALHLAVWGGRRYAMLIQLDEAALRGWAEQMEMLCRKMLE